MEKSIEKTFKEMQYSVEHTLLMYANSFFILPAESIYNEKQLQSYQELIAKSHIYFIGLQPKLNILNASDDEETVKVDFTLGGATNPKQIKIDKPTGYKLSYKDEIGYFIHNQFGEKLILDGNVLHQYISNAQTEFTFKTLYIGQAYGKCGERTALDRLRKHETLQKISLKEDLTHHNLMVLLLEIKESNTLITHINPFAKNDTSAENRISNGIDKLFDTNEGERITLFEAAMIRYFQPKYNKSLKGSFPSTRLKILSGCYNKDMQSVAAEIDFDEIPIKISSSVIQPSFSHRAYFDLHTEASRKSFFSKS